MMTFNFSESGNLYMSKQNMILNETEERESIVDVTPNWEEIPEFKLYQLSALKSSFPLAKTVPR